MAAPISPEERTRGAAISTSLGSPALLRQAPKTSSS